MSIEGIILERFSALPPKEIKSPTKACTHHAVFNDLFSDDNKQYSANTTAHIKRLIEMLEKKSTEVNIRYNMGKYRWLCGAI